MPSSRRSSQGFVRNSHSSRDNERYHRHVRPKLLELPLTQCRPRIVAILEHEANTLVAPPFHLWIAGSWMSPLPGKPWMSLPPRIFSTSATRNGTREACELSTSLFSMRVLF
jgi:hypothetical protein